MGEKWKKNAGGRETAEKRQGESSKIKCGPADEAEQRSVGASS